jgi:uncharacterized Zn finger protein (UPF0148 family)
MRNTVIKFNAVCQKHDGYANSLCCDVEIKSDKEGNVICPACGKELFVIPDTKFRTLTPETIERLRSGKQTVEERYTSSTVGQDSIDLAANYIIDTLIEEMVEIATEQIIAMKEKNIMMMDARWIKRIAEHMNESKNTINQLAENPKVFANWLYNNEHITEEIFNDLLKKEKSRIEGNIDDVEFLICCRVLSITNNRILKKVLRKKMEK